MNGIKALARVLANDIKTSLVLAASRDVQRLFIYFQEAAKALAFYRSVSVDHKEVLEEMNVIRRSLNPEMDGERNIH